MNKATLFAEQNQVGSEITLYLIGGQTVKGRISVITDNHVVVEMGHDLSTFFFEMIGGWTPATIKSDGSGKDTPSAGDQRQGPEESTRPSLEPLVFEMLRVKPTISVPEPDFGVEGLSGDDKQELIRAKNKYDYALKVREINRLFDIIPPLARLAERTKHPGIYLLCGILKLQLDATTDAEAYLRNSLQKHNANAFVALAIIESKRNAWENCAQNLLTAMYLCSEAEMSQDALLDHLGKSIGQSQNREIKGLSDILSWVRDDQRQLALVILAFALCERHPDAALLVLNGRLREARERVGDSQVFSPFEPPQREEPPRQVLTTPVARITESFGQFGYVSAVYVRGKFFFGFIRDEARNETFYFDSDHVADQELRNEIWMDKAGQKVDFSAAQSILPGKKYRMALDVKRSGVDLSLRPVERRKEITVPSKTAPAYEKARIAESLNNLEAAAKNYQEEIRLRGPYWQSAVMDLAALLHRQGKTENAINLLDLHVSNMERKEAVQNHKITILMAAKRYDVAAQIINSVIVNQGKSLDRNRRNTLLRQLVYCYYNAADYDRAIATLLKLPQDSTTHQMMQKLKEARSATQVPIPMEAAQIDRELSQWTSGISPFARFLLDHFDDSYIDARSKARGYYDKKDFSQILAIHDSISGKRPGEKARVLLTLAALCEKAPDAAGDRTTTDFLRPALSLMGEAALIEGAHNDIARFYLAEATNISSEKNVTVTLALLLSTYLTENLSVGDIATKKERMDFLSDCLNRLREDVQGWQRFQQDFVYFSAMSTALTVALEKLLSGKDDCDLARRMMDRQTLQKERDAEMERLRRERNILMTLSQHDYSVGSSFIDAANQLREQANKTRFETDRIRLNILSSVAKDGAAYINEPDYVERERKFLRLDQEISRFAEEIKKEPTKISIELILPILQKMEEGLRITFDQFVARSAVQLSLSNVLENDYYIPEQNGNVRVCVSVKSLPGGAPIEGLEVTADEEHGLSVVEPGLSPELLRGGEEREVELTIKPSGEQIADAAFSLQCIVRYRKRSGELVEAAKQSLPVRIGTPSDFSPIVNPYREYAGGRSVDDPLMFIGRQELLDRIINVVTGRSGQCFVLYGQKRSGKTSVLRQLKKRLVRPHLAAEVTVGALETTSDDPSSNFFQLCLDSIQEALEDLTGIDKLKWWPGRQDVQARPLDSFKKAVKSVREVLGQQDWHSPQLVLLIDEFTYLYEYISEGVLPQTFMKHWKSFLQLELFNAVIVGQDSMPKFKQAYPNEFGVTYDERITYLSRDEAIRLAQDPILLNGASRYRGLALNRLLKLTAGSPFYMQIFCDRLVRYMNVKQAPFITEADVEMVCTLLTSGDDALPIERFDPLITAAGESVAEASRDKYLLLLANIALNSDAVSGARPSDLPQIERREAMLKDMQDRDVIAADAEGRIQIRVQLFQEWLKVHADFIDIGARA